MPCLSQTMAVTVLHEVALVACSVSQFGCVHSISLAEYVLQFYLSHPLELMRHNHNCTDVKSHDLQMQNCLYMNTTSKLECSRIRGIHDHLCITMMPIVTVDYYTWICIVGCPTGCSFCTYDASTSQTKCILGQCDGGFVMKYNGTCLSIKMLELFVIKTTQENNLTQQI